MSWSNRIKAAVLSVAAVTTFAVMPAATASASPIYGLMFQNSWSKNCLEISGASLDNFAPADQYPCVGYSNQIWDWDPGTGMIRNENSKKCLEDMNYRTDDGAPVGQWTCYGGANQQWDYNPSTGVFINRYSKKCLDDFSWNTAAYAPVVQWNCLYGGN